MSVRFSWSSAVTLRSTNSPILSLVSRRSLETSLTMSLSTWMICSSVSVILPLACAREAMYCARSPFSLAASRSSVVRRVSCTRC